jgi:RHS repeat-associated protein
MKVSNFYWGVFIALFVLALVFFKPAPALAVCTSSCDGLPVTQFNDTDADPSNDTPPDFSSSGTYPGSITEPTVTVTPNPTNPNLVTLTVTNGTYTYQVGTVCVVVCGTGIGDISFVNGLLTLSGAQIFPTFSGIPANAVVSHIGNQYVIDLTRLPANQCTFSIGHNAISENGVPLYPSYSTDIPIRPGCAIGGNAQKDKLNQATANESPKAACPTGKCGDRDAGDPVDIFSGAYYLKEIDLSVPALMPLPVGRVYYSAFSDEEGLFGKGTGLQPYGSYLKIKTNSDGTVLRAPGTAIIYSSGNHTEVTLTDTNGTLTFTAPDKTGFADSVITVQVDAQNQPTGAVLQQSNGQQFFFDAHGDLIRIQDRHGNSVVVARDGNRRAMRIEDPSTHRGVDFTYDASGHVTQATGVAGQTVQYTYDGQGRLTGATDAAGKIMQYAYDVQNRIIQVTDRRGTPTVQNTYDADGKVSVQAHGDGSQTQLAYPDETTRMVTDENGHTWEHRFESHGLVTSLKSPLNQVYGTVYSPALFDNSGGVRTVTTTDPQGRMTVTELNALNQPVKSTDAAGRITSFTYEPNFHLLASIQDPLNRLTRFTYDAQGNVIEATDPAGNKSVFTYNTQGQVLTAKNALNQISTYMYDSNHNVTQVTDPLGNKTHFTYDALSRLTQITDAKGNSTQYAYDILNRVTQITDALGKSTTLAYDENGNVVSTTNPRGKTTTASYDARNRLISTTNPKGETTTLSYDGAGNIASTTDAKGQSTTYTYDADDRKTQAQYADGTTYSYSYDTVNRLSALSDGAHSWSFAYDILDRLISESTPQGSLNYTYDVVSRLTGFSSPNTNYAAVQYAYDNLDRLLSVSQNGKTYSYSYDALGRRTALNRPNGVSSTYQYDADNRLTTLTHQKGTTVLEKETLTYDADGNVVGNVESGLPYGDVSRTYSYDGLNRLSKVDALGISPNTTFSNFIAQSAAVTSMNLARQTSSSLLREQYMRSAESYGAIVPESGTWTFDENGNFLQKTARLPGGAQEKRVFTYDSADRLTQVVRSQSGGSSGGLLSGLSGLPIVGGLFGGGSSPTPVTLTLNYDANGNLVSDSSGRTFTWNALDQLTVLHTPSLTAQFEYEPLGRRTRYTKGSTLKTYFLNGMDVLSDGSAKFLHGAGIDQPLQVDSGTLSASYLQDRLGSTSQLVDSANGSVKTRYDYKSYGKLEGNLANPQSSNLFTYTAREDDGTGLMYYRARYYDPELEAFVSADPLGGAQRYVGGNPAMYVDPMGLELRCVQGSFPNCQVGVMTLEGTPSTHQDSRIDEAIDSQWNNANHAANLFQVTLFAEEIYNFLTPCKTLNPEWAYGVHKSTIKWTNRMIKGNWTPEMITETLMSKERYPEINKINPGNPALRYVSPKTGLSVVRDEVTKEIIHVGEPGYGY